MRRAWNVFCRWCWRSNDFTHVAVISDKESLFSQRPGSAMSKISGLDKLGRFAELISVNESIWESDTILLGTPISPLPFKDGQLVAFIIGIPTPDMGQSWTGQ